MPFRFNVQNLDVLGLPKFSLSFPWVEVELISFN